ncbi:DUF2252 domain-containing protein [Rhodobacteraceae bacterium CCMM004]|nr:DUF2252 domain-containing protein [Rhodobacteraceae bacterium CCMM004]
MARKASTAKKKSAPERKDPVTTVTDRADGFAAMSGQLADTPAPLPPRYLTGHDRRRHVRATLREDHAQRINERADATQAKFDKLAGSLFSFFRGTALLFYRDMAGEDGDMPTVLVLGDVHPSNFGIMPNADNVPIFGVNDFDEATYAPFTWDLKRGAVGFLLAAAEMGGLKRKKRRKVIKRFVAGYLDAMRQYAQDASERTAQFRFDNSPKVIRRLFEEAWEERESWLWSDFFDAKGRGFRNDEELVPVSSRVEEFQKYVTALAKANGIEKGGRVGDLKVKDVAMRHGAGTASLGLPRYYVLLEGPSADATDDLVIEFKRARRSALHGLTPPSDFDGDGKADRIAHGQKVQLAHGDIFYGAAEIDGVSFMTRERAPYRDDIDLDELSFKSWKAYADMCGRALAQAHARSDDLGEVDYDVEPHIIDAADPQKLFTHDILEWAEATVERLSRDHKLFCEDHAREAFTLLDRAFR